jgi:non-ribosomal peptide synthetase component F
LSSVDLLSQPERGRLEELGNWAALTRGVTAPVSVPAMFAAQVACRPQAVAISCEGRSLSYRERSGNRGIEHLPRSMAESMAESWRSGAAKALERQFAALVDAQPVKP